MRVWHVSWEYPPVIYGGLGRHVHALAEAQAAAGHDVTVVTQFADGASLDERVDGVRVVRAPQDPPALPFTNDHLLAWVANLGHALTRAGLRAGRTAPPDVVHAHDWLTAHAGASLKDAYAVPLVATMHATEAGRHQGWLPGPLSQAIHTVEWWLTFESRRVVACSEHMRWETGRLFDLPVDKVDVIPNGIDLSTWSVARTARDEARARFAGDGPLLVFAGRLEWEKGVHTLLDATARLRRRHPGLRLVVAGQGSKADDLRAQARRLRLGRGAVFAGWLPEASLRALVAAADVAVVPSIYEPFGMVALEAAALGTPLVVSRTGGLAELVRHGVTGRIATPGDVRSLVTALTAAIDDPLSGRRMARAARDTLRRAHDWPSIAARTVVTYQRAAVEEAALDPATGLPGRTSASPGGPERLRLVVRDGNLLRDA